MEIRPLSEPDVEAVRQVATASLDASYPTIDEDARRALVDELYAPETLVDGTDEDFIVRVATVDGTVVGVAQGELVSDTEGKLLWIHVHPEHRGAGIGNALFERVRDELMDRDIDRLSAEVIDANPEGATFYEDRGFERRAEREIEIGRETVVEAEYVDPSVTEVGMEPLETDDGIVYVDREDSEGGSRAPFFPTYDDEAGNKRHGWFCSGCDGTDIAMDTMGRIACNQCENRRKPTRWDASYL